MKVCSLILLLVTPVFAFAHTGHGYLDGNSFFHYLTSPIHIGPIIFGMVLIFWYYRRGRTQINK
jgi:hypothetical protein